MSGEKDLVKLIRDLQPKLNTGNYVFVSVSNLDVINRKITLFEFKEAEGVTVVMEQYMADELQLEYHYVASWITLMVNSSLDAVGLTAIFSKVLADHQISCNVVAGYYHDHIFVDIKDTNIAMEVLMQLSKQ